MYEYDGGATALLARDSILQQRQSFRQRWFSKRQKVLLLSAGAAAFTLGANLTAVIYLQLNHKQSTYDGSEKLIYKGDCTVTTRLNAGFHILINVLSTILLTASNFCMQLLVAPTRSQVDRAHRQLKYLDIGIPSFRNLRYVGHRQRLVYVLFALSSLPLHFLYNSAVYPTKPFNQFHASVVTPAFLNQQAPDWTKTQAALNARANSTMWGLRQTPVEKYMFGYWKIAAGWMNPTTNVGPSVVDWIFARMKEGYFKASLNTSECLTRYSDVFGDRAGLIMVSSFDMLTNTSIPATSSSVLYHYNMIGAATQFDYASPWRCGYTNTFDCRQPWLWQKDPSIVAHWNFMGYKIDECRYVEFPLANLCTVKYSMPILITVCCVNVVKLLCIWYTMWHYARLDPKDKTLAVLGDAIESFISNPEPLTSGSCLLNKKDVTAKTTMTWKNIQRRWLYTRRRWFSAVSPLRWTMTVFAVLVVLVPGAFFIVQNFNIIKSRAGTLSHVLSYGFGATDQYAASLLGRDLSQNVQGRNRYLFILFSNVWQTGVSMIYFYVNALLTCLLVNKEWQHYAEARKPLRVTVPAPGQRSTYFLSLPWRYAIPMQLLWVLLHWSLSQSCFLFAVENYYYGQAVTETPFLATSPWPSITSVILGLIILVGIAVVSQRRDDGPLPLGATCSAVISAACHSMTGDINESTQALRWGEVERSIVPSVDVPIMQPEGGYKRPRTSNRIWNPHGDRYMRLDDDEYEMQDPRWQYNKPGPMGLQFSHQETRGEVRHCCFTSARVADPIDGQIYG